MSIYSKILILDNKLRENNLFRFIIVFFIFLNLIIGANQGIFGVTYARHDDRLFLNLADQILQGHWLGKYNNLTLAKGCFYPLFIAFNFILGLPLLLTQRILYIISGLILIYSLKFLIKSRTILLFIFVIYIYSPTSFAITRVMRAGIYSSLTIMVLAGAIGWLGSLEQNHKENKNINLGWSIYLGLSLGAFWLTREEGIWLVPSLTIITIIYLAKLFSLNRSKTNKNKLKIGLVNLLLPFIIFATAINTISMINFINYGIYTTVDIKSKGFVQAYSALMRVKSQYKPFIPVPREAREKIYQISPAFKELQPFLETSNGFISESCRAIPSTCQEKDYAAGWFIWALRDAVASAGYYVDANQTDSFYQKIAREINQACDEQKLDCKPFRKSLASEFRLNYVQPLITSALDSLKLILTNIYHHNQFSLGDTEGILFFQDITHNRLNPLQEENIVKKIDRDLILFRINGWAFLGDRSKYFVGLKSKEKPIIFETEYLASEDLVKHFHDERLNRSRFSIKGSCYINDCYLSFYQNQNILAEVPIKIILNNGFYSNQSTITYHIESIKIADFDDSLKANIFLNQKKTLRLEDFKSQVISSIGKIYTFCLPILFVTASFVFVSLFLYRIKQGYQLKMIFWINLSLFLAILLRILLFSYINVSSYPTINLRYLSPCIPILLVWIILVYLDGIKFLSKIK